MNRKMWTALTMAATTAALAACSMFSNTYPEKHPADGSQTIEAPEKPGFFGRLFGSDPQPATQEAKTGLAVNAYLWRASLDTLAFMPLASADPFGGVIITDWYSPAESPKERFKMSVYIMDRTLRADSLRVSVFRQAQAPSGTWVDAAVDQKTAVEMENAILTRAREMRSANVAAQKN
ncbi:MAG: DUF3576 domain-containing protein [Telmatospirillum sp.]|nr:DUF3576 domain-containing protein [Telmatospirillum sp.]